MQLTHLSSFDTGTSPEVKGKFTHYKVLVSPCILCTVNHVLGILCSELGIPELDSERDSSMWDRGFKPLGATRLTRNTLGAHIYIIGELSSPSEHAYIQFWRVCDNIHCWGYSLFQAPSPNGPKFLNLELEQLRYKHPTHFFGGVVVF